MVRRDIVLAVVATSLIIAACGAGGPSPAASARSTAPTPASADTSPMPASAGSSRPSSIAVASSGPPPSGSSTRSPTPAPSPSRAAGSTPTNAIVGKVVTTLADDGLRVRSEPRISDDSEKLVPLLPPGSKLYVLEGPVSASGYSWYEVVPLTSRDLPTGWVASADRNGEPWIAAADFACPPVPTDLRSLAALPSGVGLACFPRVPITVQARLISCNCDVDGAWYTPWWFFLGSGSPGLLVEPAVTAVPPDFEDWFVLNLDPTGEHPDQLPVGQIVEVTGIFDHPAASGCTRTEMDGDPVSSSGCRLEFAVTDLRPIGS
jgi:hypothetical protein